MFRAHPAAHLIVCIFIFSLAVVSTLRAGGDPASQLLSVLLAPDISDKEWQVAADAFEKLPADAAARALYPEIAKGLPDGVSYASYNCSDPRRDRLAGMWGHYCVSTWLWCRLLSCAKVQQRIGPTLLELWAQPRTAYGQSVLLSALDSYAWVPQAEGPVHNLFLNSEAPPNLRLQAAACLLHHFGNQYHREVVSFALFGSREKRVFLFRALAEPPHARLSGVDPAVVRLGFWLLLEEVTLYEDRFAHRTIGNSYYGEFLVANLLGTYLGQPSRRTIGWRNIKKAKRVKNCGTAKPKKMPSTGG